MKTKARQSGQAIPEYAIIAFLMIVALFVPWGGQPSAVAQFLNAVRTYHTQASYPLSLP